MSRIFLTIVAGLFIASMALNHTLNKKIEKLRLDNEILISVLKDPFVELGVDRSTGTAWVTVNYLVTKEFPKTCRPEKRL